MNQRDDYGTALRYIIQSNNYAFMHTDTKTHMHTQTRTHRMAHVQLKKCRDLNGKLRSGMMGPEPSASQSALEGGLLSANRIAHRLINASPALVVLNLGTPCKRPGGQERKMRPD